MSIFIDMMNSTEIGNIREDLDRFIEHVKEQYGIRLELRIEDVIGKWLQEQGQERVPLGELHQILIDTAKKYDPEIVELLDFSTRRKPVIDYSHCFAYIAHKLGYKKIEIAAYMGKDHATVINSIRRAGSLIEIGDPEFTLIYNSILNTYRSRVGRVLEMGL